uniref:Uncharacterized protein TCIL3000_10_11870 n=1 Tax=Trypanosoma congolense (strain IL3000) TaxID=1068625 RepID=G0UYD9_TRYCI|nr:unnamed protein product [Trypanosoma congolense IL3000]
MPDALFEHAGHRAKGVEEISEVVSRLYPILVDAVVKIDQISSAALEDGGISIILNGALTISPTSSRTFTHEVVLVEHASAPGSFGIVRDKRENVPSKETEKRWALETPPMFANEAPTKDLQPIEELGPSTVAVVAGDTEFSAQSVPDDASAKTAGASVAAAGASCEADAVPRKPKTFAEAIKMGSQASNNSGQVITRLVVAKGTKERTPDAVARPKADASASKDSKIMLKNSEGFKKGPAGRGANDSDKNNKPSGDRTAINRGVKEGNNRNKGTKAKDSDGRALSRFVVFYDIIVKGLSSNATEKTVRDLVEPLAPVKLVKVLTQVDKKDSNVMRTFSFVQLDHEAIKKSGGDVKATVAMIIETNKARKGSGGVRVQIDEVREKYTATPAQVGTEGPLSDAS